MKAEIIVQLKQGVLDPQGSAINQVLNRLDLAQIQSVRQGKLFEIEVNESDPEIARQILQQACEKVLANTVIESYQIRFC